MVEPWRREDSVIWSGYQSRDSKWAVRNDEFGSLVHIDGVRAPTTGADGTYERPYASTEDCLANNCPLPVAETVLLWQGKSETNPYGPFQLAEGQTLWGQGVDLATLRGISGFPSKYPEFGIPGFEPGLYPVIDPQGGAGVILAPNSTVVGVAIAGGVEEVAALQNGHSVLGEYIEGEGDGIVGSFGPYSEWERDGGDITIAYNKIAVSGDGIVVSDYNNGASTTNLDIIQNTIRAGGNGIDLYNAAGGYGNSSTQNVLIDGNEIVAYYTGVAAANYSDAGGIATQDITISGNTITAGRVGVGLRNEAKYSYYVGPEMAAAITPSDVTAGSFYATQTVRIQNNSITATGTYYSGGTGIYFTNSGKYAISGPGATAAVASLDGGEGLVVNGLAGQFVTIEGNTIVAGNGAYRKDTGGLGILGYNVGKYGRGGPIVLEADNGTVYADAYQQISISGNTVRAGEERTGYVDGGEGVTYYDGGEGISLFNAGAFGGDALQVALIDGNDIMAGRSGIVALNQDIGRGILTNTAEQQLTITDNTVTVGYYVGSSGGSVLQLYNVAKYGGHAEQVVDVSGNSLTVYEGGVGIYNVAHDDADRYYAVESLANQTVTLSGNTISDLGGLPGDIDNPARYAAVFVANYAGSGWMGDANQNVTLTSNSITSSSGGVALVNVAESDDHHFYYVSSASAYQVASLTGNTISSTGFGVVAANEAADGADATQFTSISGGSIHVDPADWIVEDNSEVGGGVVALNTDDAAVGNTAYQKITVSGVDIESPTAGIALFNLVENGGTSTQEAFLTGNTVDAVDYGIYAENGGEFEADFGGGTQTYGGGRGTPTQTITLGGNTVTVTGEESEGLWLKNTSRYYDQVAHQTVLSTGSVNDTFNVTGAYGVGVRAVNVAREENNAAITTGEAVQDITLRATINSPEDGVFAENTLVDGLEGGSARQYIAFLDGSRIESDQNGIKADNANYNDRGEAIQSITLTGTTVIAADDGIDGTSDNYATYYGYVSQSVTLQGGSVIDAGETGVQVLSSNYAYYGEAVQTVNVTGSTITSEQAGIYAASQNYYTGDYGSVTQTITVTGSSITSGGEWSAIVAYSQNTAKYGDASQSITVTDSTLTGDWNGIYAASQNTAKYGDASQTVTVTGSTVTGPLSGIGAYSQNTAKYGEASQTVSVTDSSVTGTYYAGIYVASQNSGYYGEATQGVSVSGSTINAGTTGIFVGNQNTANYGSATSDVTISGDPLLDVITAGGNGIELASGNTGTDGTANQLAAITGVKIDADGIGLVVTNTEASTGVAEQRLTATSVEIDSGGNGVDASNTGEGGLQQVGLDKMDIDSDANGLAAKNDLGTQVVGLSFSTVIAALDGVNVLNTGATGGQTVALGGDTIVAGQDGVDIQNSDGTQLNNVFNETITATNYGVAVSSNVATQQTFVTRLGTINGGIADVENLGSGTCTVDLQNCP